MRVFEVRNVNEALDAVRREMVFSNLGLDELTRDRWVLRESRNGTVLEAPCPVATVYERPFERVSFSRARDANPFFHFFESLWIMAGRQDVEFLQIFNKRMLEYSDDGKTFHAPYGHRLRRHWRHPNPPVAVPQEHPPIDQILSCVELLRADPNTRRAVMSIWDPRADLGTLSKDIPCNDMVFFKTRRSSEAEPYRLDITVCCRSNDVIWGAYGANAVQFSVLHELMARELGMDIGTYTQISDSFHIYIDNEAWKRIMAGHDWKCDPYPSEKVRPVPLLNESNLQDWLRQSERFCVDILTATTIDLGNYDDAFFREVAIPMWNAWWLYRSVNVSAGIDYLETQDLSIDWLEAAIRWLVRRIR